jgi:hypothetical protein
MGKEIIAIRKAGRMARDVARKEQEAQELRQLKSD